MYSMARRDYEHAIRMFEQAIRLDGMYALAYAGMADAYSFLYRYADASAENVAQANRASEKALVLDPQSAEAHASRGLALVIGEQYEEAHKEFDIATTLNPHLFEAYCYYGMACSSQGDHERAAQFYARAIEINPADFQVPMFLAQSYASMGRRQDEMRVRLAALSTLNQHIRLNPHDTRALYMSALNLFRVGEKQRAMELAEQALRQDQDEPVVLYNVACFYASRATTTAPSNCWRRPWHWVSATGPGSRPTATWIRCTRTRASPRCSHESAPRRPSPNPHRQHLAPPEAPFPDARHRQLRGSSQGPGYGSHSPVARRRRWRPDYRRGPRRRLVPAPPSLRIARARPGCACPIPGGAASDTPRAGPGAPPCLHIP